MKIDIYNTQNKYDIIYADPPWRYNDKRGNDPKAGGITYQTMTLDEIKRMPVANLSEKNCALFMWVTMPMLREGLEVIDAWGFKYVTCAFTWVKQNPKGDGIYSGLGMWTNGNAELCLFARRGKPKREAKDVKQIVMAHRERHSKKPDEVRDRIVKLIGDKKRIELFAREHATGWDCWGNEV